MRCLIEDEADTARYISNGLKEAGFTVRWCRDGLDDLHLAAGERWDIVILDRMLNGLSIVRTIRDLRKTTPVLVLSALASLDERVRGLRSGGDDYLTNGFARIYWEENERRTDVKFSVRRGRDLGSVIADAQQRVDQEQKLPRGYRLEWSGSFENEQRAVKRLAFIIPAKETALSRLRPILMTSL
jgi:two-component system OmpR family response regulator